MSASFHPTRVVPHIAAVAVLALLVSGVAGSTAEVDADGLEIVFIDVEGGAATLVVTPGGQSLLIDAGYGPRRRRGGGVGSGPGEGREAREPPVVADPRDTRDPDRILAAIGRAGLDRLDYLLVTHFHGDHTGGVPELASRLPIGTFIDYGEPLGSDRMANGAFGRYAPVRARHGHLVPGVGDRLPLEGVEAVVVSADGRLLADPLEGGGDPNGACVEAEDHIEDGTENFRSIGVLVEFGQFRFLAPGDLSGDTLTGLVCPTNRIGEVSAYLIAHHGEYDSSIPAVYAALRPQVAVLNNGPTKGGAAVAFRALRAAADLQSLWQLHASPHVGAENAPERFIANLDDGDTGLGIRLTAYRDGRFRMVNERTGFAEWVMARGR